MNEPLSELIEHVVRLIPIAQSDWGALHPILVHFPLVLLFVVPFFILAGLLSKKNSRLFLITAFIFLLVGTGFIYLSASSGEIASEKIDPTVEIIKTLREHDKLALDSRLLFTIATALFGTYLGILLALKKKSPQALQTTILIGFLIFYSYSLLILLNTAHYGGKLVHHHGITSQELYENSNHAH